MKLPRPRLTILRLIVAVAMASVVLGIFTRRERFRRIEQRHWSRLRGIEPPTGMSQARREWHFEMYLKYREAARRFWMPLGADPPEPMP